MPRIARYMGCPKLVMQAILFPLLFHSVSAFSLQESGVVAPLGKLNVPAQVMASHCLTMVSPNYPQSDSPRATSVLVRVVIWKTGQVSPMRVVSGPPALGDAAMNAVRQWRYKPYVHDEEPVDVTTDVRVDFDPTKPGGFVTHPKN
jgi:TonB family protein